MVGSPTQRVGSGWKAFPEGWERSRGMGCVGSPQGGPGYLEAFLEGQEGLGGPLGEPGEVERARRGWEAPPKVQEGS